MRERLIKFKLIFFFLKIQIIKKAAYDLWMTDSSITKELKNEYTLADANC